MFTCEYDIQGLSPLPLHHHSLILPSYATPPPPQHPTLFSDFFLPAEPNERLHLPHSRHRRPVQNRRFPRHRHITNLNTHITSPPSSSSPPAPPHHHDTIIFPDQSPKEKRKKNHRTLKVGKIRHQGHPPPPFALPPTSATTEASILAKQAKLHMSQPQPSTSATKPTGQPTNQPTNQSTPYPNPASLTPSISTTTTTLARVTVR